MSGELSGERSSFFFPLRNVGPGLLLFCLPGPSPVSKILQWKIEIRALKRSIPELLRLIIKILSSNAACSEGGAILNQSSPIPFSKEQRPFH